MRFHTKAFTSLFLAIAFVALTVSGVVLYVAPRCRVADQIGWTVALLEKGQWESIHINSSLFFVLAGALHLVLNWSLFAGYIKKRGALALNMKREMLAAIVLGGLVLAGSMLDWPPFRSVVALHEHIKDSWGRPLGREDAATHPKQLSLRALAQQMLVSAEEVVQALETEGYVVSDPDATVGVVAELNAADTAEVLAAIERQFPGAHYRLEPGGGHGRGGGGGGGGRGGGGMGQGRGRQWRETSEQTQ